MRSNTSAGIGASGSSRGAAFADQATVGDKPLKVSIQGRVNIDTSSDMRRTIGQGLRSRPPALTIELSGVTYIDTSGLATLLEASRLARQQGTRLVLNGLHDQPRDLMHLTQIDRLFEDAAAKPRDPQDPRP